MTMISIIIPTLNAEEPLSRLLTALRSQTVRGEILVVDSSSTDRTAAIAESCGARTMTIRREDFDHGGSRTAALRETTGEIIIYLTQDVLPFNERAVENLLSVFSDSKVGAAFGRQLPYPGASAFGAHLRLFNYPETSCIRELGDRGRYGIKTPFLSNSFAAYRRLALEEVGGFRERLISGEDTYAGARLLLAGYRIAYVADAAVYHSHNYSVFREFRRYFDIGVFHASESWILDEFGSAGGEGLRYIRSELAYLLEKGKYLLLPEFVIRNCLKYAGYHLGRRYEKIPAAMVRRLSMHSGWWDRGR
ncbi:MAG: glycosyltransferase family 2 protein [Nitrospirae bacterium]|nr:glycosyltransferase family 2 protein [Nitrospirota bacterium]